jgi:hypothetical protein
MPRKVTGVTRHVKGDGFSPLPRGSRPFKAIRENEQRAVSLGYRPEHDKPDVA